MSVIVTCLLQNIEELILNMILGHKKQSLTLKQFLYRKLQNRKIRFALPLLTLAGGILWPVNNIVCRLMIVISAVCLAASICFSLKRHRGIAAGFAAFILVICGYMSLGQQLPAGSPFR